MSYNPGARGSYDPANAGSYAPTFFPQHYVGRIGKYTQSDSVQNATEFANIRGIDIAPNGQNLILTSSSYYRVIGLEMSAAWDASTATYNYNWDAIASFGSPAAIQFNRNNGLYIYLISGTAGACRILRCTLSVAYNCNVLTNNSTYYDFSTSTHWSDADGLYISSNGDNLYVSTNGTTIIRYYYSGANYDINLLIGSGARTTLTVTTTLNRSITLSEDGHYMAILSENSGTVSTFFLPTAFDITTAQKMDEWTAPAQNPQAIVLGHNGTDMFIACATNTTVYQYTLGNIPFT